MKWDIFESWMNTIIAILSIGTIAFIFVAAAIMAVAGKIDFF